MAKHRLPHTYRTMAESAEQLWADGKITDSQRAEIREQREHVKSNAHQFMRWRKGILNNERANT